MERPRGAGQRNLMTPAGLDGSMRKFVIGWLQRLVRIEQRVWLPSPRLTATNGVAYNLVCHPRGELSGAIVAPDIDLADDQAIRARHTNRTAFEAVSDSMDCLGT